MIVQCSAILANCSPLVFVRKVSITLRSEQAPRNTYQHVLAGVCLGVAMISLMNTIWLQSAPTAFIKIVWKFFLILIISESIGAVVKWFFFPDTSHRPLKDIAAIFWDRNEVAIYQKDFSSIRQGEQGKIQSQHQEAAEKVA